MVSVLQNFLNTWICQGINYCVKIVREPETKSLKSALENKTFNVKKNLQSNSFLIWLFERPGNFAYSFRHHQLASDRLFSISLPRRHHKLKLNCQLTMSLSSHSQRIFLSYSRHHLRQFFFIFRIDFFIVS